MTMKLGKCIFSQKPLFNVCFDLNQIKERTFRKLQWLQLSIPTGTSFNHDKILSRSLLTYEVIQDLVQFGCLSSIFETINLSDGQPLLPNPILWRHFFDSTVWPHLVEPKVGWIRGIRAVRAGHLVANLTDTFADSENTFDLLKNASD